MRFLILIFSLLSVLQSKAALVNFYSNPRVPQPLFHVTLEYQGYIYEADPRAGGRRVPVDQYPEVADTRIEISDDLVNEQALQSQMGLPFDFKFVWDSPKTYCSKLVGLALGIAPQPMDFSGTHYVKFYPDWINRHDLGLSPDQIYSFAMDHAVRVYRKAGH